MGGNSKTCLIITCSPSSFNEEETISTLWFGAWAKKIKNKPKINKESTIEELMEKLAKAEEIIKAQEKKIKVLEKYIEDLGEKVPDADH